MIVIKPRNDCRQAKRLTAFTLVEVLVTLTLVSILAGMVMTAVNGVTRQARIARTRSIIAIIDSVLQEQYESYKHRPLPIVVPTLGGLASDQETIFDFELRTTEAARVRLNMLRDLQRMEMPDRKSDILAPTQSGMNLPAELRAVVNPVVRAGDPPRIVRDNRLSERRSVPVQWYGGGADVPSKFAGYFQRALPTWTEEHEGSECLYLILSSTYVGGMSALEMIPSSNIGDTDGDGMLEILDGWGRPIEFIRWPSGYHLADTEQVIDRGFPDDFDLFRVDFGYVAQPPLQILPWSMRPLVISAGGDGEFGIHLRSNAGGLWARRSGLPNGWALMSWPVSPSAMGPEYERRENPYIFIDPYLRNIQRNIPEVIRPGTPIADQNWGALIADNITNYQAGAAE